MTVIDNVDCTCKDCGDKVVAGLKGEKVELVLYVSGVVVPEVSVRQLPLERMLTSYSAIRRTRLGRPAQTVPNLLHRSRIRDSAIVSPPSVRLAE